MSVISAHQTLNIKQFSILPSSTSISHSSSMFSPNSSFSSSTNSLSTKFFQEKRSSSVVRVSSSSSSTVGFSESISEILGDVSIFTAAGESVMIKDLWDQDEGVAVVALLRHFGCPCCWELASTLKESKSRFDSAGVKLIAVGVGTPDKARILAERLPFPMDSLYADPDRKAYDVLGLYYGFGRTFFNPASASVFSRSEALRKAVKNYTIKATPDDRSSVLQQGGIFVFKGKQLLYARKDEGTGDHAPLEEIFNVCCSPVA
ncbi:hypothetical protein C5167_024573 [Papaver somniferum]|uniref:Thioredoxin domain-containing protein n=1 Tax=Papaver somniferum TaxID=3469 RepID=A0A4Y7JT00_PAPSO|nr:thioredoxin-like protein AAED1, chloroplastic [Papaver somniferum]RZC62815.1 hypothetical protein C5167_024573 [Papaver somniferum]